MLCMSVAHERWVPPTFYIYHQGETLARTEQHGNGPCPLRPWPTQRPCRASASAIADAFDSAL